MPNTPLHALNPTARFSDRADAYALFRPSYPAAAIDAIVRGLLPNSTCADIGAGTGISSRLLADRGLYVLALEPNAPMREAAAPHPSVEWHAGSAEHTGLADHSTDLVVCAQAFHWFDAPKAFAEFHRVLKPRARLCLIWNDRDDSDPLTAEYGRAIREASNNHPAALDRSACGEAIFNTPHFQHATLEVFLYEQPMTLEGLIGRALSASYVPKDGPRHDTLVQVLTQAHHQHADASGHVRMKYRTRVFSASAR